VSTSTTYRCELAWLPDSRGGGRLAEDVFVEVTDGVFTRIEEGADDVPAARNLRGLVLPGAANAHSHAFHRALRGRTESGTGTFWSWRETMYEVAARLDPERYLELARAVFAEMALAGITAVGEFHYLHHRPGGGPYDDPNAMQGALAQAAADAGIRITLLDTCYLQGGFGQPLDGVQQRFGDRDAEAWATRASARPPADHVRLGAAIHSVRAVDPDSIETVARWAEERSSPLHVHVSEQPRENEDCLEVTGRTPARLLGDRGALGPQTTAVHATHLSGDDVSLLGSARTTVCLCPTTERSLADGVGRASALRDAGSPLCVGTDSHALVDPFEEARAIELNERLVTGRRGLHRPEELLEAVTSSGMTALGWEAGRIAEGHRADLVSVDLESPRLAGAQERDLVAHVVFAASPADVTHVVCDGRLVVEEGQHMLVDDVAGELAEAIGKVTS
jgi:formiminoglutamate deiminase